MGTLVWDADCGFCAWSLRRMRDLGATCADSPWQRTDLDAVGLTVEDVTEAAWFVDEQGGLHRGAAAIGQALRTSRWLPVRLLGRVAGSRALRPVADPAYAWVARNRHRMPGSTDACRLDA